MLMMQRLPQLQMLYSLHYFDFEMLVLGSLVAALVWYMPMPPRRWILVERIDGGPYLRNGEYMSRRSTVGVEVDGAQLCKEKNNAFKIWRSNDLKLV